MFSEFKTTWAGSKSNMHISSRHKVVGCGWFLHFYLHVHLKPTQPTEKGEMLCGVKRGDFVPAWQKRCWAPVVSPIASCPPPRWLEGRSEAQQTQFPPPSFLSAGRPPCRLYTQCQTVRASHVWIWPRAEPWGGRCLPQCTAAKHHVQSRSSSCCSTVQKKKTLECFKGIFIVQQLIIEHKKRIKAGCTQ